MFELAAADVITGAKAANKEAAIRQVGELLVQRQVVKPGYIGSMIEREILANTYLGKGIAIPHGLPQDNGFVLKTGVAVLQLPEGVKWESSCLAHIIIGIAAKSDEHLSLLSRLTNLLFQDDVIERLIDAQYPGQIVAALANPATRGSDQPVAPLMELPAATCIEATVGPTHGLHARPATAFAERARQYKSQVKLCRGTRMADGKSVASLLTLGASHGDTVTIFATGIDANIALHDLKNQIEAQEEPQAQTPVAPHEWEPTSEMRSISGISASPGLAIGRIHQVRPRTTALESKSDDPTGEKHRLREAIAQAMEQLSCLHEESTRRAGPGAAAIFLAHRELLSDFQLLQMAETSIDAGSSAESAWRQTIGAQANTLEHSENTLLGGRAIDLRDIEARVLRSLGSGIATGEAARFPDELLILLSPELTPSETVALDPSRVAGFCTAGGGATSHTAILARSLNIPAVVGAGAEVLGLSNGSLAILDADRGMLYVNPKDDDVVSAKTALRRSNDVRVREYDQRFVPAITTDGVRVHVVANIAQVEDAPWAVESGGEGIGLMRSEFLFVDRTDPPSEQEQYEAYRRAVEALAGLPLVLRTLDIGGDKSVPYITLPHEKNPFLGVRGIRLCFQHLELFRTQLRAAYRASVHGALRLMFPMIATVAEARAARQMAEQIQREIGVPSVEIGCMIEVPSAVVMIRELAREMDFFSIGTNDLTQYVLAMDRGHPLLAQQTSGLDPAVLRMIDQTVRAAVEQGKKVAVCGDLATHRTGAMILLGLGVTELSTAIPSIPGLKAWFRTVSMSDARQFAQQALDCQDADAVLQLSITAGSQV